MATSTCLRGIFDIEKGHFDVTLTEENIKWTPLSPLQAKLGKSSPSEIKMKDIYAVKIKRRVKAGNRGGYPLGICIFHRRIDREYGCIRLETLLACVEESLCQQWMTTIRKIIEVLPERPRHLTVILSSQSSHSNSTYRRKIQVLFDYANIDLQEIVTDQDRSGHINDMIQEMDLTNTDGIVCVGDDNLVSQVINALLLRTQRDASIDTTTYFKPARCMLPVGVISTGPLDFLTYSVHKTNDPVIAALHIIFGDIQPVDVCTLYQDQIFQQFAFSALYGFMSSFIKKVKKKPWLGLLKNKYAMAKSLVDVQPHECSIEYLPCDREETKQVCQQGCESCHMVEDFKMLSQNKFTLLREGQSRDTNPVAASVAADLRPQVIQVRSYTPEPPQTTKVAWLGVPTEIPRPRSSPGLVQLDRDDTPQVTDKRPTIPRMNLCGIATIPDGCSDQADEYVSSEGWKSISDSFLNLGFLSHSGSCSLVPLHGLSPYTHLSDGTAHLILVKNTSKKNFAQHLRKYGTNKDPFDFPFTNMYRVKAVRVGCPSDSNDNSRSSLLEDSSSYNVAPSSHWNIDGQAIHGYNLEMRVHHQLLAMFSGNQISETANQENQEKFQCMPS